MSNLSPAEEAFLAARLEEQRDIQGRIDEINLKLDPVVARYDDLHESIAPTLERIRELSVEKAWIVDEYGLFDLKQKLSEAAKDVTKLLQKKRGL